MPKIFISYRHDDGAYPAHSICDLLVDHFGKGAVFFDVHSIPLGSDFHGVLSDAVARCDLLLAVIGDQWLNLQDDAGRRRLDNPDDFVRIEIEAALSRNIPVVPVLVGKANVPRHENLPPTLRELSKRQATEVRHGRDFHSHLERLVCDIENVLGVTRQPADTEPSGKSVAPPEASDAELSQLRDSIACSRSRWGELKRSCDLPGAKELLETWAGKLCGSSVECVASETQRAGLSADVAALVREIDDILGDRPIRPAKVLWSEGENLFIRLSDLCHLI